MSSTDRITLQGMRFHTCVGLLPHEASVPQPLELDLTVWLSLRNVGTSDSPTDLLDYRVLYELVASTVRVAARKPHVPIEGPLDHVEVVIERTRDDA